MDNRIVVFLVSLAAMALALLVGTAVGSEELAIPTLVIVVTAGVLLLAKPELSVFLTVALYAAGLTAPGLPGQFDLYDASIVSAAASAMLLLVFGRVAFPKYQIAHLFLIAFCLTVLITGMYRGLGFQFLGSPLWGGFMYVNVLLPVSLIVTLQTVNMPATWWRSAIVLMGILAPIPLIADLLVVHGFNFGIISLFMKNGITIGTLMNETEQGGGLQRLTSAGTAAQAMIVSFLAVVPTRKLFDLRTPWAMGIVISLMILSVFSGFRMMTLLIPIIVLLAALLQRTISTSRVLTGLATIMVVLVFLYSFSDRFPSNVQRTISWLPGISVSQLASEDAAGTITWRLDLWRESLRYIPEYFWIGKGFSYDANLYLASMTGYDSYDSLNWALVTGAYHNGYLSLLLGLGIFGLLSGIPLLVIVVVRLIRENGKPWKNPILKQCFQAFLASEICLVLVYLTVYGDVIAIYPPFFFNWAVLEALRKCDDRLPSAVLEEFDGTDVSESDLELVALE